MQWEVVDKKTGKSIGVTETNFTQAYEYWVLGNGRPSFKGGRKQFILSPVVKVVRPLPKLHSQYNVLGA